ncbi:MAG: family clan aspartic protease [Phenylobacterium sp.]|jgi:aspartyl protease family protein|nr:family clan aspartic protease [Phenylobacterium sp.]
MAMPDQGGPWEREPPGDGRRTIPRRRFALWLGLIAAVAAGVWLLAQMVPGGVTSSEDWVWIIRAVGLTAVVSTGILTAGRVRWGEKARHAAIWVGVVAVLFVGVAYRGELAGVAQRVRSEFAPAYPVATGAHELVVTQDNGGGFFVMGQINGRPVRFLIDTGASDTVLSPADARRLGVDVAALHFDHVAETANGLGYGAPFTADSLAVGPIKFANVPMAINQSPMSYSLLGMTFLRRLDSFEVRGSKLVLKWRE